MATKQREGANLSYSNTLSGGMNNDIDPAFQPENTYTLAEGMTLSNNEHDGLLQTEEGNSFTFKIPDSLFPVDTNAKVLGSTTIDNLLIVFSTNGPINDYITICNKIDGTSSLIKINIDPNALPTSNYKIGFDINFRVKAEAKILFNGDIGLYFTDNLNPIRYVRVKKDISGYYGFLGKLLSGVSTPLIDISMKDGGGSLACSSYLFAIGYTDQSNVIVGYSTFTNPYPVVDDFLPGPANIPVFDGAYNDVKANKVFELTINEASFDPSYKTFKIILITFLGFSNTPSVFALDIPFFAHFVAGKMIVQITGNEASTQLSLAEVTIPFADYRYAKEIAQLYNRLLFANLRREEIPIDFEKVANAIILLPHVEEVDTNIVQYNGTGGYKDGGTVVETKSYMRDEVYSFAIVFIIDGNIETAAYHIPAPKITTPFVLGTKYQPSVPGTFGTYYASGQTYKINSPYYTPPLEDNHVRYHVIPKYNLMKVGSSHIVNAIGVNVSNFTTAILQVVDINLRKRITGYRLVRRQRNTNSNKTILAQGLAQKYCVQYDVAGQALGYSTVPGYSNGSSQYDIALTNAGIGFAYPGVSKDMSLLNISPATAGWLPFDRLEFGCGFISPEYVFGTEKSMSGGFLSLARNMYGAFSPIYSSFNSGAANGTWNLVLGGGDLNGDEYMESTVYTPGLEINSPSIKIPVQAGAYLDIYSISPSDSVIGNGPVINQFGSLVPGTKSLVSPGVTTDHMALRLFSGNINNPLLLANGGFADLYTLNLEATNGNCYTSLYSSEYINCGLIPTVSNAIIFGGDTFISRFTFVNQFGLPVTTAPAVTTYNVASSMVGTYIESQFNCDLRHKLTTNFGSKQAVPYVDYISTSRFTDTWLVSFRNRYGIQSSTYNEAYSAENNFNLWFTKSEFIDEVFDFGDRIIYSDQSVDGEGTDRYLVFRQNSYKDIPKNRGPIWNLFAYDNDIYAQCISSTYKTNMQITAVISANNGIQSTLGAGGLFSTPELELMTISGGYGGSQDSFSGVNTPVGRFFIDRAQGKVFLLSKGLEEVSAAGQYHFFLDNTEFIVPNGRSYQDNDQFQNPIGHGCGIGYDAAGRRIIITRRSTDDSIKDFTISFSLINMKWVSKHKYSPNMYINSGIELYTAVNDDVNGESGILWDHRKGIPGSFYGRPTYNSVIELSINEPILRNKVLDTVVITGETILPTGKMLPIRAVGDFLKISSKFCNSGLRALEYSNAFNFKPTPATLITPGAVAVGYYNRQYQLSCPRNLVQNSEYSNPNGIDVNNIQPDMLFASRLKDTYFILRLDFANKGKTKISIDAIIASLRLNIR